MEAYSGERFEEEQGFRQSYLVVLLLGVMAVCTALIGVHLYYRLVLDRPFGKPMPDLALAGLCLLWSVGIFVPLMVMFASLTVRVNEQRVWIQFWPLMKARTIPLVQIAAVEARDYNPIGDYGGWGIRRSRRLNHQVYNVRGHRGVLLTLRAGPAVMIGSQRADELAAVISGLLKTKR